MEKLLTNEKVFKDQVRNYASAKEFNEATENKTRNDANLEYFQVWCRLWLKKLVKMDIYPYVNISYSSVPVTPAYRAKMGKFLDEIINKGQGTDLISKPIAFCTLTYC